MKTSRRQRVTEAVQDIREFHRLGQRSLKQRPARGDYAGKAIETEAERIGMSHDTLRKARQFADPQVGYTAAERDELCELCLESEAHLEEGKLLESDAVFSRTHILLLITVPKGDRQALQRKAIKHGWSTNRLQLEIRKAHGTRKSGGRRPKVSEDGDEALAQLEGLCERWRRWTARFLSLRNDNRSKTKGLRRIPQAIVDAVDNASKIMEELQESVNEELQRRLPERLPRT